MTALQVEDLDHAILGNRKWAHRGGVWREWIASGPGGDWVPSDPPPPEAEFFSYRQWMLAYVAGIKAGGALAAARRVRAVQRTTRGLLA